MPFPTQIKIPDCTGLNWAYPPPWPQPQETESFASTGVKWCRMVASWGYVEKIKGSFDFAAHDKIFDDLGKVGVKPMVCLFNDGQQGYPIIAKQKPFAPDTDEAQQAFVNWVKVFIDRYKGRGYIWEIYNEPNNDAFWPGYTNPLPGAKPYHQLAITVAKAIKAIAPNELVIAPGLLHCDNLSYLEQLFQTGILDYLDGVSVHPYRHWGPPETVLKDYEAIRSLMLKCANKTVPIISSEWGYPGKEWGGVQFDETIKTRYIIRHYLVNILAGSPVTMWFEWQNPDTSSDYNSGGYGLVDKQHLENALPCFPQKPAYQALKAFTSILKGYSFTKRIKLTKDSDYLLQFDCPGKKRVFAVWRDGDTGPITLPVTGIYTLKAQDGSAKATYKGGLPIRATPDVMYLVER